MASLAEIRSQYPEYADIPDGALADALYSKFYSDLPREAFDRQIGITQPAPAPTEKPMLSDEALGVAEIQRTAAAKQPGAMQTVPAAAELLGSPEGREKFIDTLKRYPNEFIKGVIDLLAAPGKAAKGELTPDEELSAAINLGMAVAFRPSADPFRARPVAPASVTEAAPVVSAAEETLARTGTPAERLVDSVARDAVNADRPIERAGNINLDRIYAPDDVKAVIKQVADENAEFRGARRETITHAETVDMANLLGMSADDLLKRQKGAAFNAEEMLAARTLLVEQATKVRELARQAEGGSDAVKADFAAAMTRLVSIQEQVSGATAEAGRTLSQFRILAAASKEEIARLVEASKARGIDDMARMVADLDDPAKVAQFASNAFKAKTSDMILEAWINALLSGPTTHAANVLSNSIVALWQIPESLTAAAISKVTGSGIAAREGFARAAGLVEGMKDGIVAGWRAFRLEEPTDLAGKIETGKFRAIPSIEVGGVEIGGKQIRIPGRLLTAADEFFKTVNARAEISALAIRQAVNEKLSGHAFTDRVLELKSNPTTAMKEAAREAAEKQTFTNPLGPAGQALTAIAREMPAVRFIMPFIRTPLQIVRFAAERSPFAPLFAEVRANLKGENGPIARDNQIARIGLGSAVSTVAASLAADGTITGGGPTDPAKRALLYADGWQPYSVKIGGTYYSFSRLEPFGMLLGVAADANELRKSMKENELDDIAALLAGSVSRNLVSKTWMKGPADLVQAIQDPERYGPRWVQRFAGTVIPTGVAQVAQANDPYLREANNILDTTRSRIPGEREKLFLKRDVFGEPIKREGSLGPDLVSPLYTSKAKSDPAIAELLRLDVKPGRLPRTIRNAELTDQEFDTYSALAGQTMKSALDEIVALPQWRELPEAVQVKALEDTIRKSRDVARTQLLAQYPDLQLRIVRETLQKKRLAD